MNFFMSKVAVCGSFTNYWKEWLHFVSSLLDTYIVMNYQVGKVIFLSMRIKCCYEVIKIKFRLVRRLDRTIP